MKIHYLNLIAGIALVGCGGTTTSGVPMVTDFEVVKQFADGTGVARVSAQVDGETQDFVLRTFDVDTKTSNDLPSIDLTKATQTTFSTGTLYVFPNTGDKYEIRTYFQTNTQGAGIFSSGTGEILGTTGAAHVSLPTGDATLSGYAAFLDYKNGVSENGTFEMTFDLSAMSGSLDANARSYAFSTDAMVIDASSGQFGTENATMVRTSASTAGNISSPATFVGQMHGMGTAVTGLGFDNAATPTIAVAIAGER